MYEDDEDNDNQIVTGYKGNDRLPTHAEFKWTPEMVKDLEKCKKNVFDFARHFYIVNMDDGRMPIKLHKYQKRMLKALIENLRVIFLSSRQIGKTTVVTIFALWTVCFQEDKRILIVANQRETAMEIFSRVRFAFEMLPNYLKPMVQKWNDSGLILKNGSSIKIASTSENAFRGQSANCVTGDGVVTIRDKETGKIVKVSMEVLSHMLEENGELDIHLID